MNKDYHNNQEDQGDQDAQDDLDDLDDNDVEVAECNKQGAGWCGTLTPCNIRRAAWIKLKSTIS